MRLSSYEIESIKEVCYRFDSKCRIHLFGSRVDDDKKGGDIDLLIFSKKLTQGDITKIRSELWDRLGEQKIDIIIEKDTSHPFTRIALKESVLL